MNEAIKNFHPSVIKPIKFIPNERRIAIELFPEEVELKNTASGSILPIAGSKLITPLGDVIPTDEPDKTLEPWEQITSIPKHDIIQRPSGAVLVHRKAVVVAVGRGYYQDGKLVNVAFKPGDIVIIHIKNIEFTFYTDEDTWKKDDAGRIKDRDIHIVHESGIIGKI